MSISGLVVGISVFEFLVGMHAREKIKTTNKSKKNGRGRIRVYLFSRDHICFYENKTGN
jgi:hypothetical protein